MRTSMRSGNRLRQTRRRAAPGLREVQAPDRRTQEVPPPWPTQDFTTGRSALPGEFWSAADSAIGFLLFDPQDRLCHSSGAIRRWLPEVASVWQAGMSLRDIVTALDEHAILLDADGGELENSEKRSGCYLQARNTGARQPVQRMSLLVDARHCTDGSIALLLIDVSGVRRRDEASERQEHLEAIGRLTGSVAHDFNNQLQAIAGFAEMASGAPEGSDERREHFEAIHAAIGKAAEISRRLLAFTRPPALRPRTVDVGQLLVTLRAVLSGMLGPVFPLTVSAPPGLWPARADGSAVEELIVGVCLNAKESLPRGGAIVVSAANVQPSDPALGVGHPGRPFVRITVTDPVRVRIDAGSAPAANGSSALTLMQDAIQQQDGWLKVEDSPEGGRCRHLYLPAATEHAASSLPAARPASVLLAEDDPQVLDVAMRVLRQAGHRVRPCRDGQEALDAFASQPAFFDLVVLDVRMPGLSGCEALQGMRVLRPDTPAILTSGDPLGDHLSRLGSGVHFLAKPYQAADLLKLVHRAVEADGI